MPSDSMKNDLGGYNNPLDEYPPVDETPAHDRMPDQDPRVNGPFLDVINAEKVAKDRQQGQPVAVKSKQHSTTKKSNKK